MREPIRKFNINGQYYAIEGKSAYDSAVDLGFEGTEEEWIDSIVGDATKEAEKHAQSADENANIAQAERRNAEAARADAEAARDVVLAQTDDMIHQWLDEHPEATTTVQDRSLTIDKMVIGTLEYVTPEMFGAVGDGVADDSGAIQACIDSNKPILANNTYKVNTQIRCFNKSLDLFGGATFVFDSRDERYSMFYIKNDTGEKTDHVKISGISFITTRDNTNVFPPTGHTRPVGSLSSNLTCLNISQVRNLVCENLKFEGMDCDLSLYNCENINVTGHDSKDSNISIYFSGCDNFTIRDSKISIYDKSGAGDHHIYICNNNRDVLIDNVKFYTNSETSSSYPVHFYSTGECVENAVVRNCYVEHGACLAGVSNKGIVVENSTFVNISTATSTRFFYDAPASEGVTHKFIGCTFKSKHGNLNALNFTNNAIFTDCIFEWSHDRMHFQTSATIEFERCKFIGGFLNITEEPTCIFTDCEFKGNTFNVFAIPSATANLKFYRCRFSANTDGIFSVRGASTVMLVDCSGTNEKASKKFNYDGGNKTSVYRLYHCTFPDLTFRDEGQTLDAKYTIFAD